MASRTQLAVVRRTRCVTLHARPPPVIRRPAQAPVARAPHRHQATLAAGGGDGRGPHVRAQSGIIAVRERLGRFSEHRDGDFSSDSRQGFENGDVAMLAAFIRVTWAISELLQELLELSATRQSSDVDNLEAR